MLLKTSGCSRKWWNLISGDLREHPVFQPVLPAEWLENDLFSALSTHVTSLFIIGLQAIKCNHVTELKTVDSAWQKHQDWAPKHRTDLRKGREPWIANMTAYFVTANETVLFISHTIYCNLWCECVTRRRLSGTRLIIWWGKTSCSPVKFPAGTCENQISCVLWWSCTVCHWLQFTKHPLESCTHPEIQWRSVCLNSAWHSLLSYSFYLRASLKWSPDATPQRNHTFKAKRY